MAEKGGRDDQVYMAKLAEQAERYDEMVSYMKEVAKLGVELTVEERNLLSVAYKNVIGARRASWRIISSIEQKEESKGNSSQVSKIKQYREKVEAELGDVCNDILKVLDDHLIPAAQAGESKSPAQLSTELIQKEAKDAVTKALADHTNRINNEKPDPVQTFKKAYGLENEDNKEDKTDNIKKDEVASKEDLEKVKKELAEQKAINRRNAIAKIIPLRMVTDVKAGGVSESLLSEVVDYWMKTPLEPKDISEFYAKQESQIEVMTPTQKVAKASVSNDSIASQISNQEPQFDAPDANASDNKDDKYANATVNGDPAWFLDFSGMLVTNPSKNTGKGAPRRLID